MLVDKFKQIASDAGHDFDYGSAEWQNLNDFAPDAKPKILLLWKDRDVKSNEFNAIGRIDFSGEFLLVVRSKMGDPSYLEKYEDRIAALEAVSLETIFGAFSDCEGWTVTRWKETEVVNELDTNVDGLKVAFALSYED